MATTISFSMEVADKATKNRIINGIAYQNGYQDEIEDPKDSSKTIPNPEPKVQFVRKVVIDWVRDNVRSYEVNNDTDAVRKVKVAEINAINID